MCVSSVEEQKEENGFLDLLRLYEYGPERLSNKHTQSLKGFKKRKERKTSEYLHHRGEEGVFVIGFCSAFVFYISHSLTVTRLHSSIHPSTHPSQHNTAGFSKMINCLNSVSDRDAMSQKYH